MSYPVYFHFHREGGGVSFAYPSALNLHVNEQIHREEVWVLTGNGINTRIAESFGAVDVEHQSIGSYVNAIYIPIVELYGVSGKMRGIVGTSLI